MDSIRVQRTFKFQKHNDVFTWTGETFNCGQLGYEHKYSLKKGLKLWERVYIVYM